jgi:hypothetical protein
MERRHGQDIEKNTEIKKWPDVEAEGTWRLSSRLTPVRTNIVGPPNVAARIKASIAACHSAASCSAFGSFVT